MPVAERLFVIAVMCALSGSLEQLRYRLLSESIMHGLTWLLLSISSWFLLRHRRASQTAVTDLWPNLAIVALALLSIAWSVHPRETATQSFALLAASAFGLYVAARFSIAELLELLLASFALIATYSLVATLWTGMTWLTWRGPEFRGWFTSNNHLGRSMSLAVLTSMVAAQSGIRRGFAIASGCFALLLLLGSTSRSAWIVLCVSVVVLGALSLAQSFPNRRRRIVGTAVSLAAVTAILVMINAEVVFTTIGRDVTLSKRTVLWGLVIDQWARRPWLGFGYKAFWTGVSGPAAEVTAALGYYPWHSHNGFIDLGVDLGFVGLTIFVIILINYGIRAWRYAASGDQRWQLWPAMYLFYFVFSNLTESEMVRHDSIYWVVYLFAAAHAVRAARPATMLPSLAGAQRGNSAS